MTSLVSFELFITNYYCLSTNKKLLVSWQFSGPYGVTKYGSGWRKDVVNQCLEFVATLQSSFTQINHFLVFLQSTFSQTPNAHFSSCTVPEKDTRKDTSTSSQILSLFQQLSPSSTSMKLTPLPLLEGSTGTKQQNNVLTPQPRSDPVLRLCVCNKTSQREVTTEEKPTDLKTHLLQASVGHGMHVSAWAVYMSYEEQDQRGYG